MCSCHIHSISCHHNALEVAGDLVKTYSRCGICASPYHDCLLNTASRIPRCNTRVRVAITPSSHDCGLHSFSVRTRQCCELPVSPVFRKHMLQELFVISAASLIASKAKVLDEQMDKADPMAVCKLSCSCSISAVHSSHV